ncbi:MAG: Hsp70 family protein, partial [Planctomycetota bacterium]
MSTAGESRLGGEDFTERLLSWALRKTGRYLEQAEMTEPLLVARLASEAELAKLAFSEHDHARLRLPDSKGNVGPEAEQLEISAAEYEEHCSALLDRLKKPLERALRDARKTRDEIDEVLLVGGATRMPIVRRLVTDFFDRVPRTDVDPDRVVALGAAVQAALILDDKGVEDLVLTDVCPFTLGIEVTKEFSSRHVSGYYLPILHRNTTIPVSTEEFVSTLQDQQTEVLIRIYQGESRRVEENIQLGELRVTGIPPGPAGESIAIRFTYDLNGLLEVEAYLPKTGAKFQTVIQGGADSLTEKELKAALKRMQGLKFYPREDLANQHLLRYGEGVVKELDRYRRESLENAL